MGPESVVGAPGRLKAALVAVAGSQRLAWAAAKARRVGRHHALTGAAVVDGWLHGCSDGSGGAGRGQAAARRQRRHGAHARRAAQAGGRHALGLGLARQAAAGRGAGRAAALAELGAPEGASEEGAAAQFGDRIRRQAGLLRACGAWRPLATPALAVGQCAVHSPRGLARPLAAVGVVVARRLAGGAAVAAAPAGAAVLVCGEPGGAAAAPLALG